VRIVIETIPHRAQRYDTCGDWQIDDQGNFHIRVSELPSKRALFPEKFAFLVAFHELIEAALCQEAGVTAADVDEFDMYYAGSRDEPGDDDDAPYYQQHQIATGLERTMAALLGVDWAEYEGAIAALDFNGEKPHAERPGD
jgi:antirestriction protein